MKAKDKNNKTLKEADWVSYNNRIYQIDSIINEDKNSIPTLVLWFRLLKSNRIKRLSYPLVILSNNCTLIDPPTAYNITDYE